MTLKLTTFQNQLINEALIPFGMLVALIIGILIANR